MSKAIRALWTIMAAGLCALALLGASVALAASSDDSRAADYSVRASIPFAVEFLGEEAAVPKGVAVEIEAISDSPVPGETSLVVGKAGRYAFDEVEYMRPGEHRYLVRQTVAGDAAEAEGFSFDETEFEVRVQVLNAHDGSGLEAMVTVYTDSEPAKVDDILFTNHFPEPPEPEPVVKPGKLPQTGDETPYVGWLAVLGACALGGAGALLMRVRAQA